MTVLGIGLDNGLFNNFGNDGLCVGLGDDSLFVDLIGNNLLFLDVFRVTVLLVEDGNVSFFD